MISLAPGTKVFLACQPVDLRNGFDGLAAKAQQVIGADPFSGHLFIFRGKRGDYLKACIGMAAGMWLIAKTRFHTESLSLWPNHFGEVACWSAAARSTRRFHQLHCLTGVCATGKRPVCDV